MKHLKLFEAFNSNILSKTLRYLSKDSRNNFLNEVKRICGELDFPLSELNDDYFEYLGFNNALKKVDGDNKIYKFWLNKEGDFLYETLTDGVVGDEKKVLGDSIGESEDYIGTGKVYTTYGQLDELEDRSKIIVIFRGTDEPDLATLFEDNGDLFAIHNNGRYEGGTPDYHDYEDWEQYGEYSWSLRGTDFKKIQLAIHKDDVTSDGDVEGPNYYLYNKHTQSNKFSSRSSLSGSEFAIVLNTGKLKDYKKVSTTKSERDEMKSGAQALKNPEDIRKSNIERRLMEIAKKEFNINTFNELFNKILFDKYILFFNLDDTIKSINQIIKLWENPVDSDDNNYMDALKKWYDTLTNETTPNRSEVNRFFGDATTNNGRDREKGAKLTLQHYGKITQDEINSKVTNTIFNTIKRLYNLRTDLLSKEATKKPNCKILSNKLQELGQLIINKVKPSTLEDIDDIVIAQEKLNSISRILLSDRYDFKKSHDVIIYWAKGLSGNDDVDRDVLESLLDKLNQMIKLVSKL
jgi:hypothetical protein